jgi:hybrid cluster-associated redox disulfide protein
MKIEKNTKIGDIINEEPKKVDVLLEAGMHCIGCPASYEETLEEACMVHGIDVEDVLAEINK